MFVVNLHFITFLLHFLTVRNPAVVGNVVEVEETKDRFHPWTVYLTASDVDACPVAKGDCQKHSHIDSVYVLKTLFAMSSMNWEFVNFWTMSIPRSTTLRKMSAIPSLLSLPWTVSHARVSGENLMKTISDWFCWAFVPGKCLEEKQSNASREGANSKRIGSFVIVLSAQLTSGKRAKIQWCWLTSLFRPHIAFSVWNRTDDSQQLQDVSELMLCRYQPALWAPDWVFILDKRAAL